MTTSRTLAAGAGASLLDSGGNALMRRPALHRPTPAGQHADAWNRPYTGVLGHAVFYMSGDGGTPPPLPTPPVPTPPTPAPAAPPVPQPPQDPGLVSFAQTDLNKMLAKEKEQGRRSALRTIATEAGLDPDTVDLSQVGSLLKQAQEASRQKMSDLERREADATAAAEKAARETAAAQALARTANFQIALLGLGAPADGLADVTALLRNDLTTAGIADPTTEQIGEYAAKLKERRPADFSATAAPTPPVAPSAPPAPGGAPAAGQPPRVPATKDDVTERARQRAAAMGLPVKAAS